MSPAFLVGFGIGSFVGVGLALLAVALSRPDDEPAPATTLIEITATPAPSTATAVVVDEPPTVTPTPSISTRRTLQVHVGPGEAFAVVGTIAGGEDVEVLGRDFDAEWVAIAFPPNSTAQGWLKAGDLMGLSFVSLQELAVVAPTPLPQTIATPPLGFENPFGPDGEDGTPETGDGTPAAAGPNIGPTDLTITQVNVLRDGRVRITVGNLGPGDLPRSIVQLRVRNLLNATETLLYNGDLELGDTFSITSKNFVVTAEEQVITTVDPGADLDDPNRANNTMSSVLAPLPTPTPVATP